MTFVPAVLINGIKMNLPGGQEPIIDQGTTLVPMRAIFEALGATVEWEGTTRTIQARRGNRVMHLRIGEVTAAVDGQEQTLVMPATLVNGITYVPLRFVATALGADVSWDGATRTISITLEGAPGPKAQETPAGIPAGALQATVERTIDGDTIVVSGGIRVRLIGVDTPETVHPTRGEQPGGRIASDFTKAQLTGKVVWLEFDVQLKDRYGRHLGYVWMEDGRMFNEVLIAEGYGQVSTYPPNVRYVDRFTAAQTAAREAGRGLWAPR